MNRYEITTNIYEDGRFVVSQRLTVRGRNVSDAWRSILAVFPDARMGTVVSLGAVS